MLALAMAPGCPCLVNAVLLIAVTLLLHLLQFQLTMYVTCMLISHQWGPIAPLAVSDRWGPVAPLGVSDRQGPLTPYGSFLRPVVA